ncbi:hypothetical protein [Micromonospora sp. CA-246542]|uniref:hypothetical protein n=1 Tax=Micromonospora sp. CA-246542 TaxID=3239959 RepID=UPI003D916BFF
MQPSRQNEGPYRKGTMRALGATTAVLSVVLIGWGIFEAATGGRNGVRMIVIGAICAAIAAIGIPLGIRRGRL